MKLKVGDKAPEFDLLDQNGKNRKLSDFLGKRILFYFYPKDGTPGCTTEACSLRDSLPSFSGVNAVVLGINTDSVVSHKKFAKRYRLPFTLLSDEKKEVVKLYDVYQPKVFLGREFLGTTRTSFLIDEKGKIAKIYAGVKPATHAKEVLNDLG